MPSCRYLTRSLHPPQITHSTEAEWDKLSDGYFTDEERRELGPIVRKEMRRFEMFTGQVAGLMGGGAVGGEVEDDGDTLDFSCGRKALDYGLYTPMRYASQRLVVAIDDVTGQLMACLKYPLSPSVGGQTGSPRMRRRRLG